VKSLVWTIEEIHALPEFGMDNGWFYGLVKDIETDRIRLAEIFPGKGHASPYLGTPRTWLMALSDVLRTSSLKEKND